MKYADKSRKSLCAKSDFWGAPTGIEKARYGYIRDKKRGGYLGRGRGQGRGFYRKQKQPQQLFNNNQ